VPPILQFLRFSILVFIFGCYFWLLFLALLLVHTDYLRIVSGLDLDKWHCFAVHMFDHWSWVPYFGYAFPGKRLSNRIPKKPSAVSYVTYSIQEPSLPPIIKKAMLCLPQVNRGAGNLRTGGGRRSIAVVTERISNTPQLYQQPIHPSLPLPLLPFPEVAMCIHWPFDFAIG